MIEQTKQQFTILYGDVEKRSITAQACYEHLFENERRIIVANKHGISEAVISRFITNNKYKHAQHYFYTQAGEDSEQQKT